MPLLYTSPRPLDKATDQKLCLKSDAGFGFAAEAMAIPLAITELPQAARTYPVVFAADGDPVPLAVTGLEAGRNLFIDEHGQWRTACYVPAYIRRFPFIFQRSPDGQQMVLCVEDGAPCLTTGEGEPLFEGESLGSTGQRALDFVTAFQREFDGGFEFAKALTDSDILIPQEATIRLNDGQEMRLDGFRVVEEARFNALSDEVFLDWRKRGWIGLVYCHLLSLNNLASLVDLQAERKESLNAR